MKVAGDDVDYTETLKKYFGKYNNLKFILILGLDG